MWHFTAAEAVRQMGEAIGRPIDVALVNTARPRREDAGALPRGAQAPLELGDVPRRCEVVTGEFWCGDIARHDRRRLAQAVWAVLARRLLVTSQALRADGRTRRSLGSDRSHQLSQCLSSTLDSVSRSRSATCRSSKTPICASSRASASRLIGRNGTGKSSLLKVISGEIPPDAGTVWRSAGPAHRAARAGRARRPATASVFDEVAERARRARRARRRLPPRGGARRRDATTRRRSTRLGRAAAPARRARRLAARAESGDWSSRGWRCRPTGRCASCPAAGGGARCSARRSCPSPTCCCSTSRPTISTSTRSAGSRITCASFAGALLFVTHDRAFLDALATRIVELDRGRLTSWPGSYAHVPREEGGGARTPRRGELERLDKKLAKEEAWLRQGVKARRTRNEGRVKALMALRAGARRTTARRPAPSGWPSTRPKPSGKLVFEAERVSKSLGGVPVIRDYSQRILRGDRVGLIGPNGSGKTTLLRLLVGELAPDTGDDPPGHAAADRLLRSAARAARSRTHRRRHRQRRQRHGRRQRRAAARHRLPRGLPVPARARAVAGEVAVGRRAQPAAARAAVRAAGQRAGARRADQRSRHRDAGAARGADRRVRRHGAARQPRPRRSSTTSSPARSRSKARAA